MVDPKEKVKMITDIMNTVIDDSSVPKNIRKAVSEAKAKINDTGDLNVHIMSAIYSLDDISNDINMPFHTRTGIWNLVSELEKLKEEVK